MSSFLLKNNDILNVTVNDKEGYIIRLNKYNGATFTVDINGKVMVGQSGRMVYEYDDLHVLMKEVDEGRLYMARIKLSGGFPQAKAKKCKFIRYDDLTPFSVYEDENGRLILWFGQGSYKKIWGTGLSANNRLDCHYLYGVCKDKSVLKDGRLVVDTTNGILLVNTLGFSVESYATKPRKLIQKLVSFPSCSKIGVCDSSGKVNTIWEVHDKYSDFFHTYFKDDF